MANTELTNQAKRAFQRLAKSVCILSCFNGGQRHASVATAVCNVSNDPPSLLICVEKTASFGTLLTMESVFAVNVLGATQQPVVEHCMSSQGVKRFDVGNWQQAQQQLPVLADAQANFVCKVADITAFETHHIIIARIETVHCADSASALVYVAGAFNAIEHC